MSLHVQLSPEAIQRLHAQRRNSTISSVIVAVSSVVLVALILGILLLPSGEPKTNPGVVIYTPSTIEDPPIEDPSFNPRVTRRPTPPIHSPVNVIIPDTTAPVSLQMPDVDVSLPSMDFDSVGDIGKDWSEAEPSTFTNVHPSMKKRCSKEDRLARLRETGGTPECETAVGKALDWFKATQSADGSWGAANKPAMTGFALLTYLGRCETPRSKDHGETVLRAITYLVDLGMKTDGKLSTSLVSGNAGVYEHAIATYALAEASTFCKQGDINVPNLFEVTRKAGQLIIDNQHSNGGWAYRYSTAEKGAHVDTSVTAWQIQALKACHHSGLEFKGLGRATRKAMEYITVMQCEDGGFAYSNPNEKPHAAGYRTMTGGCVLSLQMFDKGSSSAARKGAKYIEANTRFDYNGPCSDLYGHYYESQAMMNRGGEQWKKYNSIFRDQLLKNQNPDGSWKAPGGGGPIRAVGSAYLGNTHYRTALCTLMLETYYRFLPGTAVGTR